jgi:phenylpropionate dioxygenase-like ring-hydroxylating dioxygenase large terminal subunit
MPNEQAESNFKDKIRAKSVPVVERGGLVWAYLGSQAEPPPLPALEFFDEEPSETRSLHVVQINCNWLQALEGDIATSHFGFLHAGHLKNEVAPEGTFLRHMLEDRAPRYKVVDTEFGASYGAYRPAGNDQELYWCIAHYSAAPPRFLRLLPRQPSPSPILVSAVVFLVLQGALDRQALLA